MFEHSRPQRDNYAGNRVSVQAMLLSERLWMPQPEVIRVAVIPKLQTKCALIIHMPPGSVPVYQCQKKRKVRRKGLVCSCISCFLHDSLLTSYALWQATDVIALQKQRAEGQSFCRSPVNGLPGLDVLANASAACKNLQCVLLSCCMVWHCAFWILNSFNTIVLGYSSCLSPTY